MAADGGDVDQKGSVRHACCRGHPGSNGDGKIVWVLEIKYGDEAASHDIVDASMFGRRCTEACGCQSWQALQCGDPAKDSWSEGFPRDRGRVQA